MQTIGLNGAAETRFCYWINSSIKRERTTINSPLAHHQSRSPGGFVRVCGRDSARARNPRPILRYYSIVSAPHPAVIDGLERTCGRTHTKSLIFLGGEWIKSCWNIFSRARRRSWRVQSDCFAYKNVAQVMRNQTQTQTNREDMFGVPNAAVSSSW